MKTWKTALAAAALTTLVGCSVGDSIRELRGGETREQVEAIMGRPDGYTQQNGMEVLTYTNRTTSGMVWDRADYHVVLRDGQVASYGSGPVRPAPRPNASLLMLMRPF